MQHVMKVVQEAQSKASALVAEFPKGRLVVADANLLTHEYEGRFGLAGVASFDLSLANEVRAVDPAQLSPRSYFTLACTDADELNEAMGGTHREHRDSLAAMANEPVLVG